jgi:CheY-like chemotaxis protein
MSLKIMVVDEEPLSQKVMRSLAVPLGHTVLTPHDSQEAGQEAEKRRFDVVFMGMPRSDGLELTQQIRKSHSCNNSIIVMLTATNDIDLLRKAFGAGATFVLPKPVGASRVVPMLAAIESPKWKEARHAARLPLFTEVNCKSGDQNLPMRSMNISETGMLLQSSHDVEMGQEVSLEFKISEVRASLNVRARVVRKQGPLNVGLDFVNLAPEDMNAIQLYVMGHLTEAVPQKDSSGPQMRRLFTP